MDADRVRAYLQVACAGLGFDIGEVWWMSNESGTSTVAAIEDRETRSDTNNATTGLNDGLSQPSTSIPSSTAINTSRRTAPPKKRFLQLYTSKAYNDQRSKLVQPRAESSTSDDDTCEAVNSSLDDNNDARGDCNTSAINDALAIPAMRRSNSDTSLELEREHVLSPRIVEAVTHSTQVVWANCQRSEGLLGRSDVRLQTAIGMPVGVDEFGNVWVVVMFSPMNVESSADAIDYLKYISRSAATTRIPCLLPVWGGAEMMTTTTTDALGVARSRRSKTSKMICSEKDDSNRDAEDDEVDHHNNHHRSLVSITPRPNLSDHTEELGEGVIAKFVSFKIDDDDDDEIENVHVNDRPSQMMGVEEGFKSVFDNDVRKAPKDDWGIPMLPTETDVKRKHTLTISTANTNPTSAPFSSPSPTPTTYSNNYLDAIDDVITDAFDDASYGVWSTIMNSSGMSATSDAEEEQSCSSSNNRRGNNVGTSISTSSASIFGNSKFARLEEFAAAFLGMSVFDVADVWTMGGNSQQHEDGTGNVATNHPMHLECLFTVAATNTNPQINALRSASMNASIEVADGVVGRAYNSGCSVWSSIKEIVYDHSRRQALENCKIETAFAVPISCSADVAPSCILCFYSLLPADSVPFVMKFVQKAVQLLWRGLDLIVDPHESVGRELWKDVGPADLGEMAADVEMQKAFVGMKRPRGVSFQGEYDPRHGDRTSPLSTQRISKSGLQPNLIDVFNAPPPNKGLAPAPQLPRMVQECSPNARRFVYFEAETDGYWAVQQAVQSIRDVQLWNGTPSIENRGDAHHLEYTFSVNAAPQELQSTELSLQQNDTHETQQFQPVQYQMSHVNYDYSSGNHQQEPRRISFTYPPAQVHTDDPALIHANLIEFNAMAQLYAHDQSAPAPDAITYDGMLKSCGAISNGANDYYDVSNTTPRMTHNTNDIGMHAVNESTISAGFLDSMYGANVAQQLCTQPMDQNFHGADQKPCRIEGCNDLAVPKRPYCARHCGNRQCEKDGCNKCAQGATRFCIAHGGGRRCTFPGCDKGARDKHFCAAHGGGKRCKTDGCNKSAVGGSLFCTGHGGGRRCRVPGCDKSAQSSTEFCVKHGGGKKCQHQGCEKVARGKTLFCAAHGGGIRCKMDGCNRVAIGKIQLCRSHGGGADSAHDNIAAAMI